MEFRPGISIAAAVAVAALTTATVLATGRPTSVPPEPHPFAGCPVTKSGWEPPRGRREDRLWVAFGPTGGVYRVPRWGVAPDGSLGVKFVWQRGPGVRGPVRVQARRLDGRGPAVRRRISTRGYGPTGPLASGITFPFAGCWKVVARAGGARLAFVLFLRVAEPVTVGCRRRSMATFPEGFTSPRNLVIGPLALQGAGDPTSAETVRELGGNKFPLLVKAGHTVTVRIAKEARKVAGLAYAGMGNGPLPQGEVHLRDTADAMRFVACRRDQRSGGRAAGEPVTFWPGGVLAAEPVCVPLEVRVDGESLPRRAAIELGASCG
jgi:hypothetical protein